jgi:hypothetical protein
MRKRATTAIMVAAAGITVAGGMTLAAASSDGSQDVTSASDAAAGSRRTTTASPKAPASAKTPKPKSEQTVSTKDENAKKKLPSGVSTATSFWDSQTASGKRMSYKTLASPYWPLGTKVKITYKGESATGVVQDFGPAEWAVAQHSPPAIVDLSEKMMDDLTGVRSNSVTVKFQVLKMGSGRTYRSGGTGYGLAMGR